MTGTGTGFYVCIYPRNTHSADFSRVDSSVDITSIINEKWLDSAEDYQHDHTNTFMTAGGGFSLR